MGNAQQFSYMAYTITTRWYEVAQRLHPQASCFKASFTVDAPSAGSSSSWQEFLPALFDACPTAVANARIAAIASVDMDLATSRGRSAVG